MIVQEAERSENLSEIDAKVFRLQVSRGQDGSSFGTVYWNYGEQTVRFIGLDQAVLQIQRWLDQLYEPDRSTRFRTFGIGSAPAAACFGPAAAAVPGGARIRSEVFLIRVYFRQHTSWQGEVRWNGKKRYYRSGLELISLICSGLDRLSCFRGKKEEEEK